MPQQINIGDGVYYANYKEPFEQLEGAVTGYPKGELPYDTDGRLLCPYHDRHQVREIERSDRPRARRFSQYRLKDTYDNLGAHLAKSHDMTADEFRDEAGLNAGAALVSEQTRYRNAAAAIKLNWGSTGNHDREHLLAIARTGGLKGGHGTRTAQALNRRNVCFAQVLVTAARVQRKQGSITQERMRRAGVSERIIDLHFGSWEAFLNRFAQSASKRSGNRRTDADLLMDLRSVAQELGHTPTMSDMRRHQMSSRACYEDHFGSWTKACHKAGIEPNTPSIWARRAFTLEEDAELLAAYAMTGSYAKASRRMRMSSQRAVDILIRYGLEQNGRAVSHVVRQEQMARAADLSRRLANWPEQITA